MRFLAPVLAAATLAAIPARADIYLIAHPGLAISADEAAEAFLGGKQMAGAVRLVPFDNAAALGEFLAKVHRMDAARYETLWAKKGFREGLNPPAVRAGDPEVLSSVKGTAGGLGYVTSAPGPGVKVLRKY
jgi:hypothetical protein